MKHPTIHNNLVIVSYVKAQAKVNTALVTMFKTLISGIIYEAKAGRLAIDEIREICLSSTVSDLQFMTMIESIEFLWIKALFETPTTLEH